MRLSFASLAVLPVSLWTLVTARLHNSLVPEDPYAFPKYRVTFLNGLPVLNETAQRWLQTGLHGGEAEFLEHASPDGASWAEPAVKSIEGGSGQQQGQRSNVDNPEMSYKVELMRLGPRHSYLCLIPPPPVENISLPIEEPTEDITPAHTWTLLQPLSGNCLYLKQGWFTYAYCHNSHVRQFHELQKPPQQRPGGYKPEEDTEWEAYTLGRAPPSAEPGAELTVAQEQAIAANVELARNAGSRYLVQRWGDGTYCEKTGKKREIEIQFHCSMTMTDTLLFVKETQTCKYVLYIATPRLCGEPGFRSRLDAREEAYIRCREVVSPEEYALADKSLSETEEPFAMPRRASTKPVISPPPADDQQQRGSKDAGSGGHRDLLRAALERMIQQGKLKAGEVLVETVGEGEDAEEVMIEFVDLYGDNDGNIYADDTDDGAGGDGAYVNGDDGRNGGRRAGHTLHDLPIDQILRAAGFDVKGPKAQPPSARGESGAQEQGRHGDEHEDDEGDKGKAKQQRQNTRDEL